MKRKKEKRYGIIDILLFFNYHKESFNQMFHKNNFISITRAARGAKIKKATSLVIFLIDSLCVIGLDFNKNCTMQCSYTM
jgi:hypothetical protein